MMIDAGEGYGGDFTLEDELRDRDDNRFRPIWFNDMGRFWINSGSVFAKGVFTSHAYPTSPILVFCDMFGSHEKIAVIIVLI